MVWCASHLRLTAFIPLKFKLKSWLQSAVHNVYLLLSLLFPALMWPLLGSRSPAELCSRPLRQSFRTNLLRSQGHNWGPARHESAQLHGLCGFITVGLKNTNQTAEKQALNSATAREHVLYTALRLVCLLINAYIDWSTHWVTDLTTQLWLKL